MKFSVLAGLLALALGAASWAEPVAAPADLANGAAVLPPWAQDKLAAARADAKAHDQAYKQGAKLATFCANCHGASGQSVRPDVPNLAGQNTVYVLNQLNKFHDGRRKGAFFMEGVVKAMSNDERFAVAVYYTSQPIPKPQGVSDPAQAAQGKALYENICRKCHGDNGAGSEKSSRLAGQQSAYLDTSIRRYRDNDLRTDEKMFKSTKGLTDADIKALVAYIATLR
ncbi:c-type cytochrome [Ramlibacter alkalitolerans]|uniref:C-type cytochrome n=1 Tax=Ramlibacter alkalitolerans TaxID=2039631 RepID=A0ABS1JWS2_9BURK|nr:c-type cytochrome [Ramlibacter alkalitolerans]MBL0428546.1 c-type cytochrome [Ramlibacter alkalitolerans]